MRILCRGFYDEDSVTYNLHHFPPWRRRIVVDTRGVLARYRVDKLAARYRADKLAARCTDRTPGGGTRSWLLIGPHWTAGRGLADKENHDRDIWYGNISTTRFHTMAGQTNVKATQRKDFKDTTRCS